MNKLIQLASVTRMDGMKSPESVFASLDLNGDGKLSLQELEGVLGADAGEFLKCLDTVQKDGAVDKQEFITWATQKTGQFSGLNEQISRIDQLATAAIFTLYSKVASRVAKAAATPN
jgi:hypothetical protein